MYSNRQFLIFPITEIDKIDFNKVSETSAETVRKSIDGTKTFVKWDGEEPDFITELENTEGPYTYPEILEILGNPEWIESIDAPITE